ncbi:MAG: UvrD-helicase domain-containing protein [Firmicutes bacterium]|jgi:DNA helicase-2/ATP-dependent DNA helicase PcrA|nr:UvrD-helicase domain-containing protein [Bacillota bacterium]
MTVDLLQDLNPPQREAVTCTEGPLLILAGAGSGKTRVLTHRVAHLIAGRGVAPYHILAVTFTNKAAEEMRSRVTELAGRAGQYVWVSTFHSLCARILRQEIEHLGFKRGFTIYDESDQVTAVRRCMRELNVSGDMYRPQAVLAAVSSAKNDLVGPDEYHASARDVRERTIASIYRRYQEILRAQNAVDFDDLIMLSVRLFREHPEVLGAYQDRFRYIMVDEYQDTNHAQYILVKLLASGHRNLCVVGDDDQSIYEWRGADIRNILDFERDYPEAHVVKLEQNYRSTKNILDAANRVIAHNVGRKSKSLWTSREPGQRVFHYQAENEKDEARFIADEVQRLTRGGQASFGDFAVLYRMNAQSRAIEEVLLNRGIPYRIVGGLKFYERREVKDVLAYLRVVYNPDDDVSVERIINVPKRGIGESTLAVARALAAEEGASLYRGVVLASTSERVPARARRALSGFISVIESLVSKRGQVTVSEMVEAILDDTGYVRELEAERTVEAESRIENLREMLSVTREFEARQTAFAQDSGTIGAGGAPGVPDTPESSAAARLAGGPSDIGTFLEEVALLTDLDRTVVGGDSMTLMTLHSAKGLEFPTVFIAGVEENIFPLGRSVSDRRSLEEERRLCYVGITRARDRLYLLHAANRTIYGQTVANPPSRFLSEIPDDLLADAWEERFAVSRVACARHDGTEYGEGDRVWHAKFGEGVVVAISPSGRDHIVDIAFPGQGIKQFALSFAPLRKL